MEQHFLETLACPCCHGKLQFNQQQQMLICTKEQIAFPFRDGIPVLLKEQAQKLNQDN